VQDRIVTMAGAITGASLGLAYGVGLLVVLREKMRAPWVAIGLRVLAAWIAAVAALMLALVFAPGAEVAPL
jgi:hypothetical protein